MNEMDEYQISPAGISSLDFPGPSSSLYMTLPTSGDDIAGFFGDSLGWIPDVGLEL